MTKRIAVLMALILLAAAPAAAGGGEKGDWEFGPYVGYGWLDSYQGVAPDNDFLWGARVGYFITENWSAEASWQQMKTKPSGSGPDFKVDALRLNALYTFR